MKSNHWISNNKPNCLIIDEIDGSLDREGEVLKIFCNLINIYRVQLKFLFELLMLEI